MINPNFLTNELAEKVADDYIHQCCLDRFVVQLGNHIDKSIKKDTTEQPDFYPHAEFFTALFKALEPYEKQWIAMLQGIWGEEEKIIVANLKKLKKAYMSKDDSSIVDSVMYPRGMFEDKIAKEAEKLYEKIIQEAGDREFASLASRLGGKRYTKEDPPIGIAFDVNNPEVQKWLSTYKIKLAKGLEDYNERILRLIIRMDLATGESIPTMTKHIREVFDKWDKFRTERIARTETIRASNRGALEAYKQSGVVKKKTWITHFDKRTCPHCEMMDGRIIGIEQNFWDKGDTSIVQVEEEGKLTTSTLNFDYEAIAAPPAHALCRCSVAASFE